MALYLHFILGELIPRRIPRTNSCNVSMPTLCDKQTKVKDERTIEEY